MENGAEVIFLFKYIHIVLDTSLLTERGNSFFLFFFSPSLLLLCSSLLSSASASFTLFLSSLFCFSFSFSLLLLLSSLLFHFSPLFFSYPSLLFLGGLLFSEEHFCVASRRLQRPLRMREVAHRVRSRRRSERRVRYGKGKKITKIGEKMLKLSFLIFLTCDRSIFRLRSSLRL